MAVVTPVLPAFGGASEGSAGARRRASAASVLGRTQPGSKPASRTADSYSLSTSRGTAAASTRTPLLAAAHNLEAEHGIIGVKGKPASSAGSARWAAASDGLLARASKSSSRTRTAASGTIKRNVIAPGVGARRPEAFQSARNSSRDPGDAVHHIARLQTGSDGASGKHSAGDIRQRRTGRRRPPAPATPTPCAVISQATRGRFPEAWGSKFIR